MDQNTWKNQCEEPPASEIGVRLPAGPQVGKLVIACCSSSVYSTEP